MSTRVGAAILVLVFAAFSATVGIAQAGMSAGGLAQARAAAVRGASKTTQPPVARAIDAEGKAIFEANCSSCHELSTVTSQAKDRAGWAQTVAKMVSYGAPVAIEDQQRIAAYLAATYPAPGQ